MDEWIGILLTLAMLFAFALAPLAAAYAVYAICKRRFRPPKWLPLSYIDIAAPFVASLVWIITYELAHPAKSLSNLFELFYAGLAFDILFTLRALRQYAKCAPSRNRDAVISLAVLAAIAILFCLFFPCLPE